MTAMHPLVTQYVEQLAQAARGLPDDERNELVEGVTAHLDDAIGADRHDEVAVRNALERMGSPIALVEEVESGGPGRPAAGAGERGGATPRAGALEWLAVVLLLVGGLVLPVAGWIAGAVLLWISQAWTRRQKLVGTLMVPGGLGLAAMVIWFSSPIGSCSNDGSRCSGTWSGAHAALYIVGVLILTVVPLITAWYLVRTAREEGRTVGGGPGAHPQA